MVVDVLVTAVDPRQDDAHPPRVREAVVERGEQIAVQRLHFVMVPTNLPDADVARPGARLVLIDVFISQVRAPARFGPDSLRTPVGVDKTERRAARSLSGQGSAQRNQGHRQERWSESVRLHEAFPTAAWPVSE
jgi:hypothetical protein